MRERFVDVATALLDEVRSVAVLTADLSSSMFERAAQAHPERVINVGIREQLLISAAGGLALTGMRPIVHSFAPFLVERPFEQIKLDLGHQGVGAMLVSAGASYDIASGGRSHQSPGDVGLLSTLPGWTVHVPGHPDEAEWLLRAGAATRDCVYVRLSNQSNSSPYAQQGDADPFGFRVLRRGQLGVVLAVGPLADTVLEAVEGLDLTVLYAATVRPFDFSTLRRAVAEQPNALVILVEPYLAGTSTMQVAVALQDIPNRVLGLGVGLEEVRQYGTARQHAIVHGLGPKGLRLRISQFLGAAQRQSLDPSR